MSLTAKRSTECHDQLGPQEYIMPLKLKVIETNVNGYLPAIHVKVRASHRVPERGFLTASPSSPLHLSAVSSLRTSTRHLPRRKQTSHLFFIHEGIMDTNTITIEPKGDLLLIIGPSKTPILVSSESLGEVSPIWKALLAHLPDFASTRHRLALPKDSLNAMLALLHACHHQWDRVPDDRFPERDVVDVAILCQKYECAELMCPFRPHWLYGRETPRHVSHEDWAFACLVLGHGFAFLRLAGTLVRWNEGGGRLNLGDARGNPNGEGEKYKKTMKSRRPSEALLDFA